ncbi:EthD domain-containing protein [Pseudomonas sp. RC10]|uniref:EthD domain-containing protein n=1 Tax=Pseudomonas bambusae TaxID=3139142 RepID=UPI0031386B5C
MIKMSLFLTRRSDLTFEQFSEYWANVHWPIVQTVPEVLEHTIRYVQQHNVGGLPEGVPAAPFDGYAEAWIANKEAIYKVIGSPKWDEIVAVDDENFLDRSKTLVLFTEEKVDYVA